MFSPVSATFSALLCYAVFCACDSNAKALAVKSLHEHMKMRSTPNPSGAAGKTACTEDGACGRARGATARKGKCRSEREDEWAGGGARHALKPVNL